MVYDVQLDDRLVSTRLAYVEASAALAMAERIGRIKSREHGGGRKRLDELWPEVDIVELDEPLMTAAAHAARRRGLRGYDAVHLAAAVTIDDKTVVAAAGGTELLDGWPGRRPRRRGHQ